MLLAMDGQFFPPQYKNCKLCHRLCGVDRGRQTGFCGMPDQIFAARAALHYWEEPCISGICGSGTVFFSGCSLRCAYCQNHDIALGHSGIGIDIARLAEIFLELQEMGAANINLVTPTHYVPSIIAAISRAREGGLALPIVYNTGNFETLDTLKMLEGYVDVYLPDFKYWSDELAARYSGAPGYAGYAAENIAEMFRQVGVARFSHTAFAGNHTEHQSPGCCPASGKEPPEDETLTESETCLMARGVVVRHLMLPGRLADSKNIIRYLYGTYGNSIYLSIMNQYTPIAGNLTAFPELNRKVSPSEYDALIDFAVELGVENAFIQEGETATESFIPNFCGEGILKL